MKPYIQVPLSIAKVIADDFGKDIVIVIGFDKANGTNDITYYTTNKADEEIVRKAGMMAVNTMFPGADGILQIDTGKKKTND